MTRFKIIVSRKAECDIADVYGYIAFEIMYPLTAKRYWEGIMGTVDKLVHQADVFTASDNEFLQRLYGANVRTVHYKKMTIVYNINRRRGAYPACNARKCRYFGYSRASYYKSLKVKGKTTLSETVIADPVR